jgi:hypothetical protein
MSWQISDEVLGGSPSSVSISGNEYAYRALVASYGQLGRIDEARAAVAEELRIDPELTLAKVEREIASVNPNFNPDFRDRYLDGLRKAGLPE